MSEISLGIKLKADGSNLKQVVEGAADSLKKLSASADVAGKSSDYMGGREKVLLASLKEKVIAAERGEFALLRYQAAQIGAAKSAEPLIAKLEELKKAGGQSSESTDRLSQAIGRIGAFGASLFALDKLKDFGASILQAGIQADKFSNILKFATGSSQAAASEMLYLRDVSSRLGLEINSSAQAYGKLAAAARGTRIEGNNARLIFEAVASASTVMGLSAEETSGALLAISQMISKGTVAAEELRGQLGERLPGAFQIAARAMGVTTAELGKMLEQGEVMADDFLPKFATELKKSLGDAPQNAINGTQAKLNQLSNSWTEFKKNIADSGVITLVLKVVEGSNNAMQWFNHFVFGKGELADSQRQLNNPDRLKTLRAEQELLIAGGNNLDPANTLERRQQRLAEIAAEVRKLQKEIGIVQNGNALPGDRAITGNVVMPLTGGSQIMASSGKDAGGGYGQDINKLNEQQQRASADAAKKHQAALDALTTSQQAYMSGVGQLGEQIFALNAPEKTRIETLQETLDNMVRMPPEIRSVFQANLDLASAQNQYNEELARTNALMELQQQYDDAATAQAQAFSDSYDQILRETEDINIALISSDEKRAAKQLEIEHQRRVSRISLMQGEQDDINLLLAAEEDRYKAAQQVLGTGAKDTNNFMKDLGATFTSTFEDAIAGGKKFSDVLAGLAQDIERMLTRRFITDPLMKGLEGAVIDPLSQWFGSLIGSANGNIFSGSPGLHQYVNTVQTSPKFFGFDRLHAFAAGGVFAEAGPEAVMPLRRMGSGRLGVEATGSGAKIEVNVYNAPGTSASVQQRDDGYGNVSLDVIINMVENMMGNNIARGSGLAPFMEHRYGLNRTAGVF